MSKITNESTLTSTYELPDGRKVSNSVTSNTSTTENMSTSFSKVRETDAQYATPSDVVKQTLTLINSSDYDISNVRIKDIISGNATFKADTLKIDEVLQSGFDPIAGFTLPNNITAGDMVVITYELQINDEVDSDVINLMNEIKYDVNEVEDLTEHSNQVQIEIVECNISVTKTASPEVVITGQTITFKDVIQNKGTTTNTDVKFSSELPSDVEFIAGSIKIDDVEKADLTLDGELTLDDLTPGKTITIEFQAKVL